MGTRWFNTTVVLLWLSTMSWLFLAKVLPPLRRGDPPNYRSLYSELSHNEPAVCWRMTWNDRPLGQAISRAVRDKDDMTEVHSRVHFTHLPLDEMTPAFLRPLVRNAIDPLGELQLYAESRLVIDPLGRLVAFNSALRLPGRSDAISVHGSIVGTQLKLHVESGGATHVVERYLPEDALMGDELSPQARMPGLREGQTWTTPVYSPLRPLSSQMEVLQARVEAAEPVVWDGQAISALVVVYRSDTGSALVAQTPRGRLWVARDGTVLRQEVSVLGSRLAFVRLTPAETEEALKAWGEELGQRHERRPFGLAPRQRQPRVP